MLNIIPELNNKNSNNYYKTEDNDLSIKVTNFTFQKRKHTKNFNKRLETELGPPAFLLSFSYCEEDLSTISVNKKDWSY